ncbi:hypothetical protein C0J52_23210 [Blattella germanica]|nr:hypothetical protein C0J52_23210 [Blattella germanica]
MNQFLAAFVVFLPKWYVMGWDDAENVHDTCVVQLDHYVQLRRKLLTSRCTLQTCIQPSCNVH